MKLLVFSDSHNHLQPMLDAVQAESPDMVLHLGDLLRDAEALAAFYPKLPVTYVPGNCDGWTNEPNHRLLEVAGRRILMGHGHFWQVKQGYAGAVAAARDAGADILLFGHTHLPYCAHSDGLWVMNPGAVSGGGMVHYGIIILEKSKTMCYTVAN